MALALSDLYANAVAAFTSGDDEAMAACFAPGATWQVLDSAPDAGLVSGVDAILRHLHDWLDEFEGLVVDVHSLEEHGNALIAEITLRGRGRVSGAEARVDYVQVFWADGGRFVRARELDDIAAAHKLLGVP